MPATPDIAGRSIRRHLLVSAIAGLLLVGGMGGWAATTELSGAVIAPGQLVAESSVKLVQHPTGHVFIAPQTNRAVSCFTRQNTG
jgi:HlyD family secretion protein